jgi:hypothetical protein
MKTIKIKVPDNKVDFFLELMADLNLKTKISKKNKVNQEDVHREIEKEFKKMRELGKVGASRNN